MTHVFASLPDPNKVPFLTVEEAGRILRLGRSAAYDYARIGAIPVIRVGGRRLRVPTVKFYAQCEIDPPKPKRSLPGAKSLRKVAA